MFTTTQQEKPMLIHDGFKYIDYKKKETYYWECQKKRTLLKCKGRAKTDRDRVGDDGENVTVVVTQQHICVPSAVTAEATRIRSNILKEASNTTNSPRTVLNQCLAGVSNSTIAALPKLNTLTRAIKRKRNHQQLPNIPRSRAETDDNNRIIIFASATDVNRLSRCSTWLMDGTFRTSPGMYYQLWVLHGLYRNRVVADQLLEQFGDTQQHQEFIEYMENTWIGRPRRNFLFAKEMWNSKDITEFDLPRTTNSLESWHRTLRNTFGYLHPNFFRFMDGILNENLRTNALCVKLDAGEEKTVGTRLSWRDFLSFSVIFKFSGVVLKNVYRLFYS
ncbi:hypothetical protein ACQ4LE_000199 [Meloidogyne hapla]|uniref:FLYWCH-type domain-containing protein n=1 Tax=Meloidogyne hapla TaxID=6305 RepID=A0A1I8BXW5_MELHA